MDGRLPPKDAQPRGLYPPNQFPPAFAKTTAAPCPYTRLRHALASEPG